MYEDVHVSVCVCVCVVSVWFNIGNRVESTLSHFGLLHWQGVMCDTRLSGYKLFLRCVYVLHNVCMCALHIFV